MSDLIYKYDYEAMPILLNVLKKNPGSTSAQLEELMKLEPPIYSKHMGRIWNSHIRSTKITLMLNVMWGFGYVTRLKPAGKRDYIWEWIG